MGGWGLHTVGKGLMVAEGSLWETAIIKLLPFEQKLSIEAVNQKEMHCVAMKRHEHVVSRGVPTGIRLSIC